MNATQNKLCLIMVLSFFLSTSVFAQQSPKRDFCLYYAYGQMEVLRKFESFETGDKGTTKYNILFKDYYETCLSNRPQDNEESVNTFNLEACVRGATFSNGTRGLADPSKYKEKKPMDSPEFISKICDEIIKSKKAPSFK